MEARVEERLSTDPAFGPYARADRVDALRAAVDRRLDELVPSGIGRRQRVVEASRYGLLAPGKRIRPLLTLCAALHCGSEVEVALDVACATEMVHTASLILDDLPSMDDAALRRGQPTTHMRFGESTAILAAVALLNQAFATLARNPRLPIETRLTLVDRLAAAIGFEGLVAGQDDDLNDRSSAATMARLESLNHRKTSVLFEVALEIGARVAGAEPRVIEDLRRVARHLGLAYQIADDLFDGAVATSEPSPKDRNKDGGKPTIVTLLGIDSARARFEHHMTAALAALPPAASEDQPLRDYITTTFAEACRC